MPKTYEELIDELRHPVEVNDRATVQAIVESLPHPIIVGLDPTETCSTEKDSVT